MSARSEFFDCRVCGRRVRPNKVSAAQAPGTLSYGSSKLRMCGADYQAWLRSNVPDGKWTAEKVEPERRSAPWSPEEIKVAHLAAKRVRKDELKQVLGILGLV